MRLAFIDTETTGLDPNKSAVVEFAAILVDDGEVVLTWSTKIKPSDKELEDANPKALAINGFSVEKWKDALHMSEVGPSILSMLEGRTLVGHNVGFDEAMLNASLSRCGITSRVPYRKIDTQVLVMEHLFPMGLKRASMDSVRGFLGWSDQDAHTALKDAQDAMRLFNLLWRQNFLRKWLMVFQINLLLRFGINTLR
jgi:DNA polymerase-3 subunit epsilon